MHQNTEHVPAASAPSATPEASVDQRLVAACLAGDEQAWAALIGRHKRLIYSHCRRYGAHDADAADIFQQVCAELFTALPRMLNRESVRSWIITVATHEAYRWKRRRLLRALREGEEAGFVARHVPPAPSAALERAQREEAVRAAIGQLPPRCQAMLRLLFYEDPPVPYHAVAGKLGLAIGSIGLTRARCLRKLSRLLTPGDLRQ
jgi:RNA polymerase sigma factor (sigma-70 family)